MEEHVESLGNASFLLSQKSHFVMMIISFSLNLTRLKVCFLLRQDVLGILENLVVNPILGPRHHWFFMNILFLECRTQAKQTYHHLQYLNRKF